MAADGGGTAGLVRAFQRHGVQLASKGRTLRGVLRRDWRFLVGTHVGVLALEVELVCVHHHDEVQRALVLLTSAVPSPVSEQPASGVVTNALGERFLGAAMRPPVGPDLALLEPGERAAQLEKAGAVAGPDLDQLRDAVDRVSAMSRARARATRDVPASRVCRIVITALIVSRPLVESWRTGRGAISMIEQDAIAVMTRVDPAAAPVLVHVVRARAIDTLVARFRATFDALRKLRPELEQAARDGG
jgi:hypothetical protein